jgi:hypothetical protein
MSDPFESSRRKIANAEKHHLNLHREIEAFERLNPYKRVVEPHPDKPDHVVHKVKLTKELPVSIADTVGDIVQNLRNALDNATYAVAVASGRVNPKNAAFPFARSVAEMANSLGRSKDVPKEIQSLFCGFQPYLGGDEVLWTLNEMCVADKHKMVIPIGTGIVSAGVNVQGTGFFEMPTPHVWNRTKNEMELITLGPKAEYHYDLSFHVFVAFNDIEIVDGKPVLRVLYALGRKVQSIFMAIEAESRRLGIIK